ncbi:MarR family transcriptional regulator [Actinoalloteichus spitiensis]|uniref:MarR family transcriptional regulator n=1 Tax=Actinoalloteichus spitiensis TaxID=252394 RepID=UPI000375F364|nr:helix-turn-helix domain-containing protein [Actinoalloteichus spitiensis]
MDGFVLYLLGRRLMKLGEDAIPEGGFHGLPASARAILFDVIEHPGSSIGDITERTGFLQSQVSGAVARFRAEGVLETTVDPADRRRTLVLPSANIREWGRSRPVAPIEDVIDRALGGDDVEARAEVLAMLDGLARRLCVRS